MLQARVCEVRLMESPLRQPQQILAYRSLPRILGARPLTLWSVGPSESVMKALQLMAEKKTAFLVVLDQGAMVGVVSERDFVGRVILAKKSPETTPVAEIMVRKVITVDLSGTFGDCLKLMQQHNIRYLPVTDKGKPITVVSIRDLLNEAVTYQAKLVAELERERMVIFTSTV
jgi:signal-transduction protein with cAMP-binding, CBS, and nucleotidyltransferase domain